MGNQCIRDGSDDESAHKDGGSATSASSKKPHHNKYEASERIVSLEHQEHPHSKLCPSTMVEKNFREFSRIFTLDSGAMSVVTCDGMPSGAKQLLAAGEDKSITLLNYETGHVMKQWRKAHDRDVNVLTRPHASSGVFASGSRDTTIRLWKASESAPLRTLKGHKLNVTSVDTNPEGTLLVSGSRDNSVCLWDVESGALYSSQDIKLNIVHFVRWIAPLGCVAQGGEDLTIRLWDVRSDHGRVGSTLHLRTTLTNFDYHPICCDGPSSDADRAHVLYTGHNGFNQQGSMILEWDLRMEKPVQQFDGHGFTVRSLKLLRSNRLTEVGLQGRLLSASDDGTLRFWNTASKVQPQANSTETTETAAAPAAAGAGAGSLRHSTDSLRFEFPEGRVSHMDETADGLILLAVRNGCIVVLRPSGTPEDMHPMQRYRYVGDPAAVE